MKEKKESQEKKRLKEWLKERKEANAVRNFNRQSHYNRDVCY